MAGRGDSANNKANGPMVLMGHNADVELTTRDF